MYWVIFLVSNIREDILSEKLRKGYEMELPKDIAGITFQFSPFISPEEYQRLNLQINV